MLPTVYIETSFISYLVARPSRNARVASNQDLTHKWWQTQRPNFKLYVSAVVLGEAARGDVTKMPFTLQRLRRTVSTIC